jgi:putative nucleotidyltransferase with HDIG domain
MISLPGDDPAAALAQRVAARLRQHGHEAWLVGGCVRDLLLDRRPADYDVATDALPDQTLALFPRALQVGKAFGVIIVREGGEEVEVATYRADGDYADGRHPESVRFTDAREDALRRDFTVNALFQDPATGEIRDFVEGRRDLESKMLRAVGDPAQRFREDALRVLRAVRLAADLGFEIDSVTLEAVRQAAPTIHRISPERIQEEMTKGLTRRNPGRFLRLLSETGLMAEILPEMVPTIGCEQPPEFHPEGDVFVHTCLVLDYLPDQRSPALAWAALLHDVGKPPCMTQDPDGRLRFNGHAKVGAEMVDPIADRLRWSNELREAVIPMVARHMDWMNIQQMRQSTLRRWLAAPTMEDEFWLHRADCLGSWGGLVNFDFGRKALETFATDGNRSSLPSPLVNGRDLIALGIQPGPRFKKLLDRAFDAQLDGTITDREAALIHLREITLGPAGPD